MLILSSVWPQPFSSRPSLPPFPPLLPPAHSNVYRYDHRVNRVGLLPVAGLLLTTCATATAPARNQSPAPVIVQAGAPGQASRTISARDSVDPAGVAPSAADVSFMQGMIGHHAQAVEMTALLSSRTERPDMRLLARRIELSQSDEIAMMRNETAAKPV